MCFDGADLLLMTALDMDSMLKYISYWLVYVNRLKVQAALAAANTGREVLLPLVQALIGSDDKMLDKMARWAVEHLDNRD